LRRTLGTEKENVERLLEITKPLTMSDWTTAVHKVRADKNDASKQSVDGIGSASDTLRELVDGLKTRTRPQPPRQPPAPSPPRVEPSEESEVASARYKLTD